MSKIVNVNNMQQLIDLNKDLINFKLDFKVSSENNQPFETVVVSQTKLDSGEPLEFKKVDNGIISGNIVADNGSKQNYYLVLKSDTPTKCTIEIILEEIPLNENIRKKQEEYNRALLHERQLSKNTLKNEKQETGIFNWKTILFLLVIVGGIILYYLFFMKKGSFPVTQTDHLTNIVPVSQDIELPIISSETLDLGAESVPIFNNINQNLLDRLNNIQMY
jgi:hypothetical protein